MDLVPPFHRRVYEAARSIPRGATMTYGALAARIGAANAVVHFSFMQHSTGKVAASVEIEISVLDDQRKSRTRARMRRKFAQLTACAFDRTGGERYWFRKTRRSRSRWNNL
jgi:hypothetical protein